MDGKERTRDTPKMEGQRKQRKYRRELKELRRRRRGTEQRKDFVEDIHTGEEQ